jgi:hypothetical protein
MPAPDMHWVRGIVRKAFGKGQLEGICPRQTLSLFVLQAEYRTEISIADRKMAPIGAGTAARVVLMHNRTTIDPELDIVADILGNA